jgi:hypothetical protein
MNMITAVALELMDFFMTGRISTDWSKKEE